jgi:uncharacterized membrane protein YgaE (UPF0421/DUF939 family)
MFLCVVVINLFKLEYALFAILAAIFSIHKTIENSLKSGLERFLGTVLGALFGYIFTLIQPHNPFLVGIGAALIAVICKFFRWEKGILIAVVVFASIMLTTDKDLLHYSINWIIVTFIGIVIAIVVNELIFPPNSLIQIQRDIREIAADIKNAVTELLCRDNDVNLDDLRGRIIKSIDTLETYADEYKKKARKSSDFAYVKDKIELMMRVMSNLDTVDKIGQECSLNSDNTSKIKALKLCSVERRQYENNDKNIIYNYNVGEILDALPQLIEVK